ncbi:MAG: hypothetical protein M3Z16_12190 [Pseudomonadota bacterium]|nr:hypothetical protein [Pseudomonadota bacterium]
MTLRRSLVRSILAASGAGACLLASAQLVAPRTAAERSLVESVASRMSSCFTMLGPKRDFPVTATAPPQSELLAAVLLHASGPRVSDGYNYVLMLHGRSNAAFVAQLGGFAATRRIYGPLPLDTQCSGSPHH